MSYRRHLRVVGAAIALTMTTALLFAFGLAMQADAQQADDWPRYKSDYFFEIIKDPVATPPPFEAFDLQWLHLHRNHPSLPDAPVNVIAPRVVNGYDEYSLDIVDVEVRYVVRDVPVSGWLGAPYRFELDIDNAGLSQLADGVHGLTIEARGADRLAIQPIPAFVHISRDLANGEPFGFTRTVPVMSTTQENPNASQFPIFGPSIQYVDPEDRVVAEYPIDPSAESWSTPPAESDLYQEQMAPNSPLFAAVQMWWDHPAHSDAPFVRGLTPKHGEDHRFLRIDAAHERFPMKDGPRGSGWMSPYVSGQIDSLGRFAFAETGGRVAYLLPDGEIVTIAGWRVKPDLDPLWWEKPTEVVRRNMENRGNWTAGRGEFFTPLDVAVDPLDENILYVAAYEDHVIWKIEVPDDIRNEEATVSILAGDPDHEAGYADGTGSAARFSGPGSLVFDPIADVLYVADQDNDAIRSVDRSGQVTTVVGDPGMQERLIADGIDWTDQLAARAATQFEVTPAEANNGVVPDIFRPQTIRVDSEGRIILLELGYGAIRQIDPATLATKTLGEVRQKHAQYDRGWAWLDVDRWGNSGPKDGIYWAKFVSTIDGENFNEVFEWLPPGGGESVPLFPSPTGLYPDGWGRISATNAPHYAWLVAVDPRGGVLLTGGGEHGVTRLRPRRASDPIETREDYWLGRQVFYSGAPVDAPLASVSLPAKFGWNGHNYLGLTDAWQLEGATDAELLDAFEVPAVVRDDPEARRLILSYIRPNTVGASVVPPPPPPPPPLPALPVPGLVQAEAFSEAIDTDAENRGNADVRPGEAVDIWATSGVPGSYTVGRTRAGEQLRWDVEVTSEAPLVFAPRVASGWSAPGGVSVTVNDMVVVNDAAPVGLGWWAFETLTATPITLTPGTHRVEMTFSGDGQVNVDRLDVTIADDVACWSESGHLSWTSTDSSVYWIYRSTDGGNTWSWIGRWKASDVPPNPERFRDRYPIIDAQYQVRQPGAPAVACTTISEPEQSLGLVCASDDLGRVTWTDLGATKYWVYRSIDDGATWTWAGRTADVADPTAPAPTEFVDDTPAADARYLVHFAGFARTPCSNAPTPAVGVD